MFAEGLIHSEIYRELAASEKAILKEGLSLLKGLFTEEYTEN